MSLDNAFAIWEQFHYEHLQMGRTRNNLSDLFQDRLMTSSSSPPTIIALFCYSFKSWLTRQGKCILYPVTELLSMMSLRGVLRRGNLLRRTKKVNFARGSVLAFLCVLRELSEKKKGRLSQRTPSIAKGKIDRKGFDLCDSCKIRNNEIASRRSR